MGTFLGLEGSRSVLEQFLLPAVEHRWPQAQFFTQLRDGHFVHKMPPQDGYFFFWGEMLSFFPHTFAPLSSRTTAVLHFQLRQDTPRLHSVSESSVFYWGQWRAVRDSNSRP